MKKCVSILLAVLVMAGLQTAFAASDVHVPAWTSSDCFPSEDDQKLLALRFDDYRHMTISEFQDRVWEMTDTPEYMELLERLLKSDALYRLRDSDETAWFLFSILEPLTAEGWRTWTYSGAVESDLPAENARLEYDYTLTILAADRVMIKDYCDIRSSVQDVMRDILRNRTKEELQNETLMLTEIKAYIDELLPYLQTPEVRVAIEYAYFPLSAEDGDHANGTADAERRRLPYGTEEDYRALLTLKTPGYERMPLADFNRALLDWTNENSKRMERITEDTGWNDIRVALTDEELSFVKRTILLSGMENGKAIQSRYAGSLISPYYEEALPTIGENGTAWCDLYYRFSYEILDAENVTVGERDRQIAGMIDAVRAFWNGTELESLLKMSVSEIMRELERLAEAYSTDDLSITIHEEQVHFERMDERSYAE